MGMIVIVGMEGVTVTTTVMIGVMTEGMTGIVTAVVALAHVVAAPAHVAAGPMTGMTGKLGMAVVLSVLLAFPPTTTTTSSLVAPAIP